MLDFFWLFQGAAAVTIPTVTAMVVPISGLVLNVTLSEVCTGTGAGFDVYVQGVIVPGVWSGFGTANWVFTPAVTIHQYEIVSMVYNPGDCLGLSNPLAAFGIAPVTNLSTAVAVYGSYTGPLELLPDGTLQAPGLNIPTAFNLHLLLWKMFGEGDQIPYRQALCRVIANKVHVRFQVPTRGSVRMFLRSITVTQDTSDTPEAVLDWRDIALYDVYEQHSPEQAEVGEPFLAHMIGYTINFGDPDNTSITSVTRVLGDVGNSWDTFTQTGFAHESLNVTDNTDVGTWAIGPDMAEV